MTSAKAVCLYFFPMEIWQCTTILHQLVCIYSILHFLNEAKKTSLLSFLHDEMGTVIK